MITLSKYPFDFSIQTLEDILIGHNPMKQHSKVKVMVCSKPALNVSAAAY